MDIEKAIKTEEENEIVKEALNFAGLVDIRKYREARNYYSSLNEDTKKYIQRDENYKWKLKTLSFGSL